MTGCNGLDPDSLESILARSVLTDYEADTLIQRWLQQQGISEATLQRLQARRNAELLKEQVLQMKEALPQKEEALAQRQKEVDWHANVISTIEHELYNLVINVIHGHVQLEVDQVDRFIYSFLRKICNFYDRIGYNYVSRACIYTPDHDAEFLKIRWPRGLEEQSKSFNKWYIGPDPVPPEMERGIPGEIWRQGYGEAVPDVLRDNRFRDSWDPPRKPEDILYRSLVQTLIFDSTRERKLGLLSVDSMLYTFTELDLLLMDRVAEQLGRFMEIFE